METVPGDDIGTEEPPAEDPGDGDTGEPPLTDAPGAAAGTGDEPGEFSTLAATAPEIAGMSGAAAYSIPILVQPKGRGGIAPSLALVYNSSLRNGPVGVGFSLEMGGIQRNTKKGLDYTAKDFVATINGSTSELVDRSAEEGWGPNCYGSKIEGPFMKFCLDNANANDAAWTMWSKDGTKYYYGTSDASRQRNQHGIFKWRLDKVTDTSGNYMTVTYTKDHPDHDPYLQRIDFTGNEQGLAPTNYEEFILDPTPRPDPIRSYNSHVATDMVQRYKRIKIYGNGQLARQYVLQYDKSPGTSRSLLKSVTQLGSDGKSLPPITFGWKQGGEDFRQAEPWNERILDYESGTGCFQMADVNGDRKDDLVYEAENNSIRVLFSTGETFQDDQEWGRRQRSYEPSNRGFRLADFTGNGRADFMYEEEANYVRVLSSTETGFTTDLDENNVRWGFRSGSYQDHVKGFRVVDLNLDGKSDLVYVRDNDPQYGEAFWALESTRASLGAARRWGVKKESFEDSARGFYMVDSNGDGKADLVYDSDSGGSYLRLLKGTGQRFEDDTD